MKISSRQIYAENGLSIRDNSGEELRALLEQYVQSPEWESNYDKSKITDGVIGAVESAYSAANDVVQEITKIEMKKKFGTSGEDEYLNTISQEDWDAESNRHDGERAKNNWDDEHKYDAESDRLRGEEVKISKMLYPIVEAFFKEQLKKDAVTLIEKTYGMSRSQMQDFKDGL